MGITGKKLVLDIRRGRNDKETGFNFSTYYIMLHSERLMFVLCPSSSDPKIRRYYHDDFENKFCLQLKRWGTPQLIWNR